MTGIFETLVRGGVVMIPLLLTSVIGLAVVIERAFFLRRRKIIKPEVSQMIASMEKPKDIENVIDNLGDKGGPFLNIVRTALENRLRSRDEVREAIVDQGRQEARTLERGLVILETVAGIAPLIVKPST